jgi:3-dehydroshikimate dehydratase
MITPGLVSITFRQLDPHEIVDLVKKAGLDCIEWGGDVHVPHGDVARAREAGVLTRDAGLRVSSYGSYYRVGESEKEGPLFRDVLASACELGAPLVRVWAGRLGSADASDSYRRRVVDDALRIARMAAEEEIEVAFEYHGGTLTDTNESALRLLAEVADGGLRTYWQPAVGVTVADRMADLGRLLPHLVRAHVFHWAMDGDKLSRRPLSDGRREWTGYLDVIRRAECDIDAMIEFVAGDDRDRFLDDARTLRELLG